MSPKAAETRGEMKIMDEATNVAEQLKIILNAINAVKIYMD